MLPLPEADSELNVPPVVVPVAGAVVPVTALARQKPEEETFDKMSRVMIKFLLIAVQAVAAPSELRGNIPLVAHVLETHGAPFKMQISLLKHKYWPDFILDPTPRAQHYFECLEKSPLLVRDLHKI